MSNQSIDDVRSTLRALIRSQYESNSGISFSQLRDRGASGYRILPALLAYSAGAARKQITTILRDELSTSGPGILALFVPMTDAFDHRNNQFLTVTIGSAIR